jgi:hypothetical protein
VIPLFEKIFSPLLSYLAVSDKGDGANMYHMFTMVKENVFSKRYYFVKVRKDSGVSYFHTVKL